MYIFTIGLPCATKHIEQPDAKKLTHVAWLTFVVPPTEVCVGTQLTLEDVVDVLVTVVGRDDPALGLVVFVVESNNDVLCVVVVFEYLGIAEL